MIALCIAVRLLWGRLGRFGGLMGRCFDRWIVGGFGVWGSLSLGRWLAGNSWFD